MPSDIMEQRGVSTPSHFHEDIHITSEVNSLFSFVSGFKLCSSRIAGIIFLTYDIISATSFSQLYLCFFVRQRQFGFMKTDMMPENQGGRDRLSSMPKSSWTSESYQLKPQSSFSGSHPSGSPNARNTTNGSQWESSLFSSSMSDLFSRKRKLLVHLYGFFNYCVRFFIQLPKIYNPLW